MSLVRVRPLTLIPLSLRMFITKHLAVLKQLFMITMELGKGGRFILSLLTKRLRLLAVQTHSVRLWLVVELKEVMEVVIMALRVALEEQSDNRVSP